MKKCKLLNFIIGVIVVILVLIIILLVTPYFKVNKVVKNQEDTTQVSEIFNTGSHTIEGTTSKYSDLTECPIPTILELTENIYYIDYYEKLKDPESAKLYKLECILKEVPSVDNKYRCQPIYTLTGVSSEDSFEITGTVIEAINSEMLSTIISVSYENALITYTFYSK